MAILRYGPPSQDDPPITSALTPFILGQLEGDEDMEDVAAAVKNPPDISPEETITGFWSYEDIWLSKEDVEARLRPWRPMGHVSGLALLM